MNNIQKGYKLVPVEPTCSMVLAGLKALGGCVGSCGEASPPDGSDILDTFSAMLSAAPTPPQPIYDEAKELDLFIEFASDKSWFNSGFKDRDDTKMQFQEEFTDAIWIGWLACAQSRAKAGEVGHE